MAGDPRRDASMYENQPLNEAVGLTLNGNTRSITAAAATVFNEPYRYKGRTTILPGEVAGIRGLKLNVGGGPEGSSILSASGHNVRLDPGSQLVLVPNLNAGASAAVSGVPTPAAVSLPAKEPKSSAALEPGDETEICSPPECSLAFGSSDSQPNAAAWVTLPVKELGYSQPQHEIISFDYDSALSYLGDEHLVFTFNPHILIARDSAEAKFSKLRIIRAVLIDVQARKVVKTVDWKVPDDRQYLWTIDRNRILVHVGRELRMYGPGFRLEQHFALGGSLAFLRISPSAAYFAVGVVQERHSEIVHRELQEVENRDPEEDVEVKILDANLRTLATVVRSSRAEPPVLSAYGEIRTQQTSRNRWTISEESWDKQKRLVAAVNSTCRPDASTFPPNLLLLVGCDRQANGRWYRVLRQDGKPILKGWSFSEEVEQRAVRGGTNDLFSIAIARASKSVSVGGALQNSDLESERVAVYRSQNGERLFSVTIPSPVPTVQTSALSPNGDQLAVLQSGQIALYHVPAAQH
ncbi:MAG TPA: hypothetical protein VLL05_11400 [Terriglobales bacterium]|nr:hypothetical protein [Terriglobales bacterium]